MIHSTPTWILSVHMKATCKDDRIEPETDDDCLTQRLQYQKLSDWINNLPLDDAVIILGDFNRSILDEGDSIRRDFFSEQDRAFEILPSLDARYCWKKIWFDFEELQAQARRNNPEFDETSVSPWIYHPSYLSTVDHF